MDRSCIEGRDESLLNATWRHLGVMVTRYHGLWISSGLGSGPARLLSMKDYKESNIPNHEILGVQESFSSHSKAKVSRLGHPDTSRAQLCYD